MIDAYQYQDETTGEIVQAESVYHITLHHYDNNYMYIMTGWEENTDEAYNDIRDWVGEYAVPVYYNNGKLEFCETTLDYINFGEAYGDYYFGFYGLGNVTSGSQIYEGTLVAQDGLVMAVGEMGVEGQAATITGNTVTTSQFSVEYLGMFFCGYPANGEGSLAYWNYPMEFPLDMVKSDSAAASLQSVTAPYATATSIEADSMRKLSRKTFTPRYL